MVAAARGAIAHGADIPDGREMRPAALRAEVVGLCFGAGLGGVMLGGTQDEEAVSPGGSPQRRWRKVGRRARAEEGAPHGQGRARVHSCMHRRPYEKRCRRSTHGHPHPCRARRFSRVHRYAGARRPVFPRAVVSSRFRLPVQTLSFLSMPVHLPPFPSTSTLLLPLSRRHSVSVSA